MGFFAPRQYARRRELHFDSLAGVVRDVKGLLAGYEPAGNWSLGEACDHLGNAMIYSREGFPHHKPAIVKFFARMFYIRKVLNRRRARLRMPSPIGSPDKSADNEGVEFLERGVERFQETEGDFAEHCVLGVMDGPQWLQFHLWHCEHHLSFLIPEQAGESGQAPVT